MGLYVGQYNSDRKFFHRSADILVLELFQLNSAGRISFSSLRGFKRNKKFVKKASILRILEPFYWVYSCDFSNLA